MTAIIPKADDARLIEAAALVMVGVIEADDAAAQEGVSVADLMVWSADARAIKRYHELRDAGGVYAAKAISALEAAVTQISNLIDSGDLPPTVLLKATEVLHRVAGVDEKRKAKMGQSDEPQSKATVIIKLGPPTADAKVIQGAAERVVEGGRHE